MALFAVSFLGISGCGTSSNDIVTSGQSGGVPSSRAVLQRNYPGTVHLRHGAAGVQVDVLQANSDTVLATTTTNGAGNFALPEGLQLPPRFRVAATTPEGIRVERFVDETDIPYLWINVPTHLISLYVRRHPGTTVAESEALLRRALGISESEGLYGTSDTENSPFSHAAFLHAVAVSGIGFEGYCQKLVDALDNGNASNLQGAWSFRLPVLKSQKVVTHLLGFLAEESAKKLFDSSVEFSVGKIAGATGFHIGKKAEFEALEKELGLIEEELMALTDTVKEGFLEGLLTLRTKEVQDQVDQLEILRSSLATQAGNTYTSYPDDGQYDHGPAVVPTGVTSLVNSLGYIVTQKSLLVFQRVLTSSTREENVLTLANEKARMALAPKGAAGSAYDLRRDDITGQLLAHFKTYIGYDILLGIDISELATAGYLPQTFNVASGLQPPSQKINDSVSDLTKLQQSVFQAHQLVAEPVGSDLVLIDRENKLMWYLKTNLGHYDDAQNGMIGLELNNWKLQPGQTKPPNVSRNKNAIGTLTTSYNNDPRPKDMPGWRLPEREELQTLYKRVVDLGGGNKNPPNTLEALKKLGFEGLESPEELDHENYKKYWYNGSWKPNEYEWHEYDISKDEDGREGNAFNHNPKYTYIYVRTLDLNAPPFGDTLAQFHKGYDLGLQNLQLNLVTPKDSLPYYLREVYLVGIPEGPDRGTYPSDLSDRAIWKLTDVNPSDCAFLTFRHDDHTVIASVNFRKPGTATIEASVDDPDIQPVRATFTNNSKTQILQSIMISPQNLALQNKPTYGQFQQFYCTGYLPTGETVDLTSLVTWTIPAAPMGYKGRPSEIIGGDLVFGDPGSLPSNTNINVHAELPPGTTGHPNWTDNGKTFKDDAYFQIP